MKILCELMQGIIFYYLDRREHLNVLDVGSKDNGDNCKGFHDSLRDTKWDVIGLDLEKGRCVDVITAPYNYPFADNTFDAVIANQVMEHVEHPWVWIMEMSRVLKYEGFMIITTPWKFKIHRFPVDCWRVLPDGMEVILKWAGCKPLIYDIEDIWTYGVGQKDLEMQKRDVLRTFHPKD